jgi:hypothetical protein
MKKRAHLVDLGRERLIDQVRAGNFIASERVSIIVPVVTFTQQGTIFSEL